LSDIPHWERDVEAGIPGYKGWRLYGKAFHYRTDDDRDLMPDELYAAYARKILNEDHQSPFFLGVGFCRPHTPLYVPEKYFQMFPINQIQLPKVVGNDISDCAAQLADTSLYGFRRLQFLQQKGDDALYKSWIQAYLASIAFVDEQIGKVLEAVSQSKYADNTIVIITSDHGFHMGEKDFLYKQSAWVEACKIPMIISFPNHQAKGTLCAQPVSLVDIYPTLIEACGLPRNPNEGGNDIPLDGHSLIKLLKDPTEERWAGPEYALTILPGEDHTTAANLKSKPLPHYAVSTAQYRYIQTSLGEEELYNLENDPLEWVNLINSLSKEDSEQLKELREIVLKEKSTTINSVIK
jgi:arylsulfatase A-like enzyme